MHSCVELANRGIQLLEKVQWKKQKCGEMEDNDRLRKVKWPALEMHRLFLS